MPHKEVMSKRRQRKSKKTPKRIPKGNPALELTPTIAGAMRRKMLRMHSFSASRLPRADVRVENEQAKINLKLQSEANSEAKLLKFEAALKVEASHSSQPNEAMRLSGVYHVEIIVRDPVQFPGTEDALTAIGSGLVVRVVWPFWREFVISSTSRLGFPPLTLPMIF